MKIVQDPAALMRLIPLAVLLAFSSVAHAVDEDAARETARQNNCFKCHGVAKAKDGPAWHEVAVKLKGNPDAQAILIKHLTTGEEAKFPDGHKEPHKIVKVQNEAELKNLVDWILTR